MAMLRRIVDSIESQLDLNRFVLQVMMGEKNPRIKSTSFLSVQ